MKTGALLAIFVLFRRKSLSPIFYLLLPGSWSVTTVTSSSCDSSQTFVCTAIHASFRLQIAFELLFIYSSITWRTTRLMAHLGRFQHLIR